ncbi:restriction endonuclease subunit S [uncultured Nonlabens sp.]|uniref:restriction endonuclease subunit S n=1 Tax=uncultured Nonlabens sp. TaxID=859306 RepID=UPI0030D79073|tara:strand:- start:2132 stop:3322 length:1191 start_codon:yes stop_codon:yes gene_type:complete
MSWEEVELGSLCEIGRGSSPRPINNQTYFEGGNIPWIKIADATKSTRYIYETKQYVNSYGASFSRLLPKDSLIIAASGTLGFPMFLGVEGCIHDGWMYFKDYNGIEKEYLYYQLISLGNYFNSQSYGAAIQNINTGILRDTKINLPPLQTQKRIADILSAYDDLIENNLKRIKLLEQAAQNIYKDWFVNLRFPGHENTPINEENGLPVGWEKRKLGELVSLQQGFALNKKSRHHISEEVTKYPLLKISDLFKGIESLFVKDTIPRQFLVEKHEIIFSRTGQVGHAFMGRKGVVYNNCFRVTPNDKIDSLFLYQTLIEPQFVGYVKGLATGAAQPDLNHGAFKSIEIVLPSSELQDKFSVLKENNQTLKFNLIEQNTKLKSARDILLPRLMNRTIEV